MRVLALNCGSSSFKSALVEAASGRRLFEWQTDGGDPADAVGPLVDAIARHDPPLPRIDAIAHRVVHGGSLFSAATLLDDATIGAIASLVPLAPLHQPAALAAIGAARRAWPGIPHVAVFDTAFHASLPPAARTYALPVALAERFGLRRHGFHGINHAHVARRVAGELRVAGHAPRIVSCHLGSGASVCAIEGDRSVETSMGMTPLEGLVMGTRGGDLDPGVLVALQREGGLDLDAIERLLNRESGLAGLAGSADMREVERRAAAGDEAAVLALEVHAHRLRKYIGAYAAVLGGLDAIAFTGGVGEHDAAVRERCLRGMDHLGVELDVERNRGAKPGAAHDCIDVATPGSRVRVMVVRADEEAEMARETAALLAPAG